MITAMIRASIALLALLVLALPALAETDVADLSSPEMFRAINSSVEKSPDNNILRWHINAGQSAELQLRPDHPLFSRLRYFDRIRFDYRITGGDIDIFELKALGHVSGPRQYKVHQWDIGQITTEPNVWHFRELDFARPNWMPWDEPDGHAPEGFFKFGAVCVSPGAVIELRNIRLVRSLVYLKPFYELPVTWPIKTENPDGSATYAIQFQLLNMSNQPDDLIAEVQSKHQKFAVKIDHAKLSVKSTQIANFNVSATISRADIAATPELYEEPLRVRFFAAHHPEADTIYETPLVRPLSKNIRRQVIVPQRDLQTILAKLAAKDVRMKQVVNYDAAVATADAFLKIRLDHIPGGHGGPFNDWPRAPNGNPLQPGTFMPEVLEPSSKFREVGTFVADAFWKEYLGYSGQVPVNLGMAYLLTHDEKYARKAIELLELYGKQYADLPWANPIYDPPWNSGPTVLCSARIAACSTYGTNWNMKWFCKMISMVAESPSWTPESRTRVYEGFILPYATEIAKFPGRISNMTDITNGNLLLLGLAFDDAHLVRWATKTDPGLITRLNDIGDDGFSSEGRALNYHFGAMAEYLPAIAHLENSGLKIDYPKYKLLAALRMPYQRANLNAYVPITGDNGRGMSVGNNPLADEIVSIFPNEEWLFQIGGDSTLSKKLWMYEHPEASGKSSKDLLETTPRLFKNAGMAILRTGNTPDEQIMLTFDYGRNPFHGSQDRNQITLGAFGRMFTQGPGSIYNAGTALPRNPDTRLQSFCSNHSLGQNVVVVDEQDQLTSIGKLIAWSDKTDFQYAVAKVDGIRPGVSHTRAVVLTHGIVCMIDHLQSDQPHIYDFVYHNLGTLALPSDQAKPLDAPLARTGNYENLVDVREHPTLKDVHLTWTLDTLHLNLWHAHTVGQIFTAVTGMNDVKSDLLPNPAPTLIHRAKSNTADFFTVLEPYKASSHIVSVAKENDFIIVAFDDGQRIRVSLSELH